MSEEEVNDIVGALDVSYYYKDIIEQECANAANDGGDIVLMVNRCLVALDNERDEISRVIATLDTLLPEDDEYYA